MRKDELFPLLDEQTSVGFTGKINVLGADDSRLLGSIEIDEGEVSSTRYGGIQGLKAFYNLCVAAFDESNRFKFVVEPEIVQGPKTIHFPYSVLKRKAAQIITLSKGNQNLRPPDHLKLLINPEFIEKGEAVEGEEYDLLASIADFNTVKAIYKNCELHDYQITNTLVSLRRKKAITVVQKG